MCVLLEYGFSIVATCTVDCRQKKKMKKKEKKKKVSTKEEIG